MTARSLYAWTKRKAEEERLKTLSLKRKGIESMQDNLSKAAKLEFNKARAAASLLQEATERLGKAVSSNDMDAIRVAHVMIQGASSCANEVEDLSLKTTNLVEKVQKSNTSLITSFFKKK